MRALVKIISALLLWILIGYILIFIDPELLKNVGIEGAYLPFFLALGLATWYTTILISRSLRMAVWITGAIIFLLVLNAMKVLTLMTLVITILIIGLILFRFLKREKVRDN